MTERDQDNSGPTQLTIDGGEVRHPPPAPRATCPACEKTITLTRRGEFHRHQAEKWGGLCAMSGRRPE